jgi:transposase-like protein
MPHKLRLSLEARVKAVESYLNGEESVKSFSKKYSIGEGTLRCWVRLYKTRGIDGLTSSATNRRYPVEIKNRAVKDYLSGVGSLIDICTKYDISRHGMLQSWIKRYNVHGDFKQPNSGGAIYMAKGRNTTLDERIEIVSHCIANNKDYGKTIEQYGISYQQIYGWVRKYETFGSDGLIDRRGKRKAEAAISEVEKLRAELKLKEAENLRLQMENELLKKLEALERGQDED